MPNRRRFSSRALFASISVTVVLLLIGISALVPSSSALTNNGSILAFGTPLTENFNTLATGGTTNPWADNTTIPGWYSQFELNAAGPTVYIANAGGTNNGAIYSFGTGTATERAFGSASSGTPGTIYNAVKLTNNTGGTVTSLDISFVGEQWRNGGNASAQTLAFQYQVANAGAITDANTPTAGWSGFSALNFVSPTTGATAAALDGNAAANRVAKSATLAVTVNAGQEVWLRWADINDAGNDHGFGIDDFSVTANGIGGGPSPSPTPTPSPSPTPTPTPTPTPSPTPSPTPTPTPGVPGSIVITQVYGGGGNAGATLKNDFIEIFNRSSSPIDLSGWSVQYSSAAGTTPWLRTPLTGMLAPGQYYLIQEAAGAGGSVDLPTPDVIGSIAMSGTSANIALVSNNVTLSTGCPVGNPQLIDLVGYGAAVCFEGAAAAPLLGNTTADFRKRAGCKDTDNNFQDFTASSPSPRNSATTLHVCSLSGDLSPEVEGVSPGNGSPGIDNNANITVTFDEPVNVSANWFQISCASSGIHTAVTTGGPTTFTINPNVDFGNSEQCTVTIKKNEVSDQDAVDPPDNMDADFIFIFTTAVVRDPAEHMVMGNPSGAVTDVNVPLNYLMTKPQYALSYNNDKGTSNWTSWRLDSTWTTGVTDRQDDFRPDDTLPPSFKHVSNGYQFATYGFDRGHMCPSADRTSSVVDNSATFLMTNMVPQASGNNQGPWASMENYIRAQLNGSANELYIISGGTGIGGQSSTGQWDFIIDTAGNTVTVPDLTWKVVIVLPNAVGDDVARVNGATRSFAVIMPNDDNIRDDQWQKYLATVDQVEAVSGYDFYSNVPTAIQNVFETKLDVVNNAAPLANSQSAPTAEDTSRTVTLTASDFNVNNVLTFTIGSIPAHGSLGAVSPPSCSNGNCTATVTYTPVGDYNGPDSFTFTVNDGAVDSAAPATVTINVTEVNDNPVAVSDNQNTNEDTPLSFSAGILTANDSAGPSSEGSQTLTVSTVTNTPNTHGLVVLNNGQVTYSPDANYNGPASFDYQVCDNGTTNGAPDSKCATGTVNVTINPVIDLPVANNDSYNTNWNTALNVAAPGVLSNDSEFDGGVLSAQLVANVLHGQLTLNSDGSFSYTPALNFAGTDSFSYRAFNGTNSSNVATVTITVNCAQLTSLGPASVWIGLRNGADVGTKFDLLAEVLKNGTVIGSGQLDNVPGGGSGFNNAVRRTINQTLSSPQNLCPGDILSFRLSVRIATTSGHHSGTARLWFNSVLASSRFAGTIGGGTPVNYFLRGGFFLTTSVGPGPNATIDVTVNRTVNGNPFKPFGTWNITY